MTLPHLGCVWYVVLGAFWSFGFLKNTKTCLVCCFAFCENTKNALQRFSKTMKCCFGSFGTKPKTRKTSPRLRHYSSPLFSSPQLVLGLEYDMAMDWGRRDGGPG
ncbi:hypothetical protein Drorol1_Dr00001468 [Drosera rotundifolia]